MRYEVIVSSGDCRCRQSEGGTTASSWITLSMLTLSMGTWHVEPDDVEPMEDEKDTWINNLWKFTRNIFNKEGRWRLEKSLHGQFMLMTSINCHSRFTMLKGRDIFNFVLFRDEEGNGK